MSEQTNSNYQSQQHFLSDSPWSVDDLTRKVSIDTNNLLGNKSHQAFSIDESSNGKAGKDSVGVSHQYNGNKGKVDNCQTGVYASLSSDNGVGIINAKLYLPDCWVDNPERCHKAGVPKAAIVKKTKIQLAMELIDEAIKAGVEFGWINADALYGNSYEFCKYIDQQGKNFVVDVHKDQQVYLSKPEIFLPEKQENTRGRKPTRLCTESEPIEVQQYVKQLGSSDFNSVNIRKTTKGWLTAKVHTVKVWVWDADEPQARERTLIIRKSIKKKAEVKYSLSNIKKESRTAQQFAFMQAQRFWIERAFEDMKGELGMSDYQVRKYLAWHHHQGLVMLAMFYVNQQKILHKENIPLLSVRDIRLQLIAILVDNGAQLEQEIVNMCKRHEQRIYDIFRYYPDNDYF